RKHLNHVKTINDNLCIRKTSSNEILIVKIKIHRDRFNVSSSLERETTKILKQRILVASSKNLHDLMIITIYADNVQLALTHQKLTELANIRSCQYTCVNSCLVLFEQY